MIQQSPNLVRSTRELHIDKGKKKELLNKAAAEWDE